MDTSHGYPDHVIERFFDWIDVRGVAECWPWLGTPTKDGYGRFKIDKQGNVKVLAHRFAWEVLRGPIPTPTLDHDCHNRDPACPGGGPACPHRLCCNPSHLLPRTRQENSNASPHANASKTHCPEGHEYDEIDGNGHRCCRRCRLEKRRATHARRRQEAGLPVYSKPGRPSPKNLL